MHSSNTSVGLTIMNAPERMTADDLALQFADTMMWLEDECGKRFATKYGLSRLQFFRLLVCDLATCQWGAPSDRPCSTTLKDIAEGVKLLVDSDSSHISGDLSVADIKSVFTTARQLMYDPQRPAPSVLDYGTLVCSGRLDCGPDGTMNPFTAAIFGKTIIELSGSEMSIDIEDDVV